LTIGIALAYVGLSGAVPLFTSLGDTLIQNLTPLAPPPATSDQIRVLTANLWHDFPRHRNLEARWDMLADAFEQQEVDIACLQEVAWTSSISNRAQWLGETVDAAYVYGRANGNQAVLGFEEGLAIISRYPLSEPQLVEIQPRASGLAHRAVLRAIASTPAGEVAIYCAHLTTSRRASAEQIAWLQAFVERDAQGRTAIIAGDFNADDSSEAIQTAAQYWEDTYRTVHPITPGRTFSLNLPIIGPVLNTRYDYIFHQAGAAQFAVADSRLLFCEPDRISDHHGVLTSFSTAVPAVVQADGPDSSGYACLH
jgi:endonuclease/exonuclease/phosphatase family metal-dependent hydrolase